MNFNEIIMDTENYVEVLKSDFISLGVDTTQVDDFNKIDGLIQQLKTCDEPEIFKSILKKMDKPFSILVDKKLFLTEREADLQIIRDRFSKLGEKTKDGLLFVALKEKMKFIKSPEGFNKKYEEFNKYVEEISYQINELDKNSKVYLHLNKRFNSIITKYERAGQRITSMPQYKMVKDNFLELKDTILNTGTDVVIVNRVKDLLDYLEAPIEEYNLSVNCLINIDRYSSQIDDTEKLNYNLAYEALVELFKLQRELLLQKVDYSVFLREINNLKSELDFDNPNRKKKQY